MVGAKPEQEVNIRQFFSRFALIPLNTSIAERAVEIRRTTRIRLPVPCTMTYYRRLFYILNQLLE